MDKAHFKCFQLGDGTVYFGEIAYLPKDSGANNHIYYSLEDVPPASDETPAEQRVYPVRHGYGIQLFGRNAEAGDRLCYYAGKWDRD